MDINGTSGRALDELLGALASASVRVVDLTAPLSSATPVLQLPPEMAPIPRFSLEELARYDERGETSYQNGIHTGEHVGTHFDAPCHWVTGIAHGDVSRVPAERLIAPAMVIDQAAKCAADPDFVLEIEHLEAWQHEHGPFVAGWLLFRSGWASRSEDQTAFLNADETGPHTPGLSPAAAKWLAKETPVIGYGVETVGIDAGQAFAFEPAFPAHSFLLGADKYGITQLRHLDQLPATGAVVVVAPLPIVGGSGSPARILALIENGSH